MHRPGGEKVFGRHKMQNIGDELGRLVCCSMVMIGFQDLLELKQLSSCFLKREIGRKLTNIVIIIPTPSFLVALSALAGRSPRTRLTSQIFHYGQEQNTAPIAHHRAQLLPICYLYLGRNNLRPLQILFLALSPGSLNPPIKF